MRKVTFAEAKQIQVANWVRDKSNYSVIAMDGTFGSEESTQGVLIEQKVEVSSRFFWFFKHTDSKQLLIGKLWINNHHIGAKTAKNWVLQVFGRNKLDALQELAREIAKTFEVDVHVRLESETALRLDSAPGM